MQSILRRSRWPCDLRRRSATARLLGLQFESRGGYCCLSLVNVVCCASKGLCEGLIPHPEEPYKERERVCVCVCVDVCVCVLCVCVWVCVCVCVGCVCVCGCVCVVFVCVGVCVYVCGVCGCVWVCVVCVRVVCVCVFGALVSSKHYLFVHMLV